MDGRAQEPVIEYIKKNFNVDYVDMITEPGPNKILAENKDLQAATSIKKRVKISLNKHGSEILIIAAHDDCAGNPVNEQTQKQHLRESLNNISAWNLPFKQIIPVWLDKNFHPSVITL